MIKTLQRMRNMRELNRIVDDVGGVDCNRTRMMSV